MIENNWDLNVSRDYRIDRVCDGFEEALIRGENPSIESYLSRVDAVDRSRLAVELTLIERDFRRTLLKPGVGASHSAIHLEMERPGLGATEGEFPNVVGDYRLIREIGRGGMGVVYEAEQASLSRRVALKLLPLAATLDKQQLQRFQNEARAAAALHHPHTVPVFAVGSDRGIHYYAMQLIEGQSLAQIIKQLRAARDRTRCPNAEPVDSDAAQHAMDTGAVAALSTLPAYDSRAYHRAVARLGIEAAEALENAHLNGICHRDVKPANLLLDQSGRLWVTDFGLAQLGGETGLTQAGDLLGTLRYVSPEQAAGSPGTVDHRSDIYSLGATLYELLSLEPIHGSGDRHELLRKIAFEEPKRLRQVNPQMPVDLETILAKSMEKEPAARYASAREMADDLRRFLAQQPIKAKPAGIIDRLVKFSRRRQKYVVTAGAALILLSLGLGVSVWMVNRARMAAVGALSTTSDLLYMADMTVAFQAREKGWCDEVQTILAKYRATNGYENQKGLEWHVLDSASRPPASFVLRGHAGSVNELAPFGDRRRLASVGDDGTLRVWDLATQKILQTIKLSNEPLESVAVSADGHYLAAGSTVVYLIDARSGATVTELFHGEYTVESLVFSQDGSRLVAGLRYDEVCVIAIPDGKVIARMPCGSRVESLEYLSHTSTLLVPNRQPVNNSYRREPIQLWQDDLSKMEGELNGDASEHPPQLTVAVSSPSGQFVLAGELYRSKSHLFQVTTGKVVDETSSSRGQMVNLAFSPSEDGIALGYNNGVVELYQLRKDYDDQWQLDDVPRSFRATNREVKFLRYIDGRTLATCSSDGLIRIWKLDATDERRFDLEARAAQAVKLSPDGSLALCIRDNRASIVDTRDGRIISNARFPVGVARPTWSPSGAMAAICCETGKEPVRVMDRTGQHLWSTEPGPAAGAVAFSPTENVLAIVDEQLHVRRTVDGKCVYRKPLPSTGWAVQYSHDGKRIAYGGKFERIVIADAGTQKSIRELPCQDLTVSLAFSPDDVSLASGHADGVIRLWDVPTGRLKAELVSHGRDVRDLQFSPDGKTLISAADDGGCRLCAIDYAQSYGLLYESRTAGAGSAAAPCGVSLSAQGTLLAAVGSSASGHTELVLWTIPAKTSR